MNQQSIGDFLPQTKEKGGDNITYVTDESRQHSCPYWAELFIFVLPGYAFSKLPTE